jgi:hypothetical protein
MQHCYKIYLCGPPQWMAPAALHLNGRMSPVRATMNVVGTKINVPGAAYDVAN